MKKMNRDMEKNCGDSLARPYINNQVYSKIFDLSTALSRGTIFPELDLFESEMYNKEQYIRPKKRTGGKKK